MPLKRNVFAGGAGAALGVHRRSPVAGASPAAVPEWRRRRPDRPWTALVDGVERRRGGLRAAPRGLSAAGLAA